MTNRTRAGIVLLILAQGLAGCDREIKPPSGPGFTPPAVLPPTTVLTTITGAVYDTAHRPLPGAAVEVLDGPQSGTSAIADGTGQFSLSGTFNSQTRFRASKEHHITAILTLSRSRIDFYLALPVPPVNLAGEYTLTVGADSACTDLPKEALRRTYGATLRPNPFGLYPANTYFDVWVSGPLFLKDFNSSERFAVTVAGDYAAFGLGAGNGYPAFVEQLSATTYVAVGGAASTSVAASASTMTIPFAGYIDYCVVRSATEPPVTGYLYDCRADRAIAHARCESNNHLMIWERR